MAAQDAKPFHWHYPDFDDSNFKLHGQGLGLDIIIIFALAILLVLLLCLYVWWACRSGPPPASGPAASSGLDAGTINRLPVVLMHRGQSPDHEEGQCSICLGALEEGDKVKVLPACGHAYHPECVDEWLRTHSSCPLCRASIGEDSKKKKKKVLDAC